jgi:hypothetical protein
MESIILDNLVELLLGLVLMFQISAFTMLWNKQKKNDKNINKNSETINMLVNRIFGLDRDSTDEGYVGKTEDRFNKVCEKLEEISEKQDDMIKTRKEEHLEVRNQIREIIHALEEEESVNIERHDIGD